jgi:hypothetical protein
MDKIAIELLLQGAVKEVPTCASTVFAKLRHTCDVNPCTAPSTCDRVMRKKFD